jgi:hypothetical protein
MSGRWLKKYFWKLPSSYYPARSRLISFNSVVQNQLARAMLVMSSKVKYFNLEVYLTNKINRSAHNWLHTAYPRTILRNERPEKVNDNKIVIANALAIHK